MVRGMMLQPVARTMMIPLWARAAEMRKASPLVHDARALEICEDLDFDFETFRNAWGTQVGCVLRGLLYDRWVTEFLALHPEGTVVELGAGLTTRFERLDNGRAHFVDLDLPDAIALRRRYVTPSARRILLAASVLDPGWPALVRAAAPGPYLFVSEGMLMYLRPEDIRAVLRQLADAFPGSVAAFDSIAPAVVRHQRLHDSMKHMMDAPFGWGIRDVRDIEQWDSRLRVLEVATLPDIAALFRERVSRRHLLAARLVGTLMPGLARAYRLSRVALGA